MNYLIEERTQHASEYLSLSTAVKFGECLEDFVDLYAVNRHWIQEQKILFENIEHTNGHPIVTLEYMEELLNALCTPTLKKVFTKN